MRYLLLCLLLLLSPIVSADSADRLKEAAFPSQLSDKTPALALKGQGVLTYLWADVYAAALFNEPSLSAQQAFSEQRAQCLELYYFRDIDRSDVIKAADATLARQQDEATLARLKPELDQLHASFHNIQRGDRYLLSFLPQHGLSLERNGQVIFKSANPELSRVYFGLWLGPDGLSKSLRKALLNRT
ncbi:MULTISPECIES: chalcone isomerase family protein [unclassified Pseudomonas]|uniref:chalcone isomerase family protein n=1 Tax=unclassified Pseudomonas TaxID=196821 RepID=UPI002AC9DEAB|nr:MULTISPECIES: chalcone isomerase family protein [unclassified Pseudomonas]MEB0040911.1 chalcone isomerase family protein [Pseudomonas sp. MH10]MEB0078889.1 chalcone isomerase family protein [Pseudomonas sp. MH10out]MEB0090029.1 chalcone isomerase family protein [Pseudomonas sp. CCI4.2]MEB0102047.1 chalcone isomerase family protein [Pseudomonas sp. CCI3.2]MEB0120959.1 chalcone isomerase family protein [Pseudomonas sp. CCI1.2]